MVSGKQNSTLDQATHPLLRGSDQAAEPLCAYCFPHPSEWIIDILTSQELPQGLNEMISFKAWRWMAVSHL